MRKQARLLLILCLLFLPGLARADGMCRLLWCVDDKMMEIGQAPLVEDGSVALAIPSTLPEKGEVLAAAENTDYARVVSAEVDETGTLLKLRLLHPLKAAPMALAPFAGDVLLYTPLPNGGTMTIPLPEDWQSAVYRGAQAVIATVPEDVMPGALLSKDGALCGMLAAKYGEGENRALFLTGEGLQTLLDGAWTPYEAFPVAENASASFSAGANGYLSGFDLRVEDGWLKVDWSVCVPVGQAVEVMWQDVFNPYLSLHVSEGEETSFETPVMPGRLYRVWVRLEDEDATLPSNQDSSAYTMGEKAQPYTDYAYKQASFYLTGVVEGDEIQLTRGDLTDGGEILASVTSLYETEAEQNALLVYYLITPDGFSFYDAGQFTFAPELCGGDLWYFDVGELLNSYLNYQEEAASGEYTVGYALDGQIGGEITFTIE